DAKISPDGDFLAALAPDGPRVGIAIINLKALKANWAAGFKQLDISSFFWLNNDRLLFYLSEDGYAQGGIYAVNRDGTKVRGLVPLHQFHTGMLDLVGGRFEGDTRGIARLCWYVDWQATALSARRANERFFRLHDP